MSIFSGRQLDVLFVCGREPNYTRNQVLRQALAHSHRLTVATRPVYPAMWRYTRALASTARHLRRPFDVVLVGFYGQPLLPPIRALTRRPILFDAYLSTYDTACFDRRWFSPSSVPGRLAYALDYWPARWADRVLVDTEAHRDYFVDTFGLDPDRVDVLYVGCDETHFAPRPEPKPGRTFHVFTYSSFLRLHGVEHILHAAHLLRHRHDVTFTIAGTGPNLPAMQRLAQDLALPNLQLPGWVPYDDLPARIAEADLCLGGHFGAVAKAGRVIATKTFQFLAMGKPTIVGDNPASREVMSHLDEAYLCPMADPQALATAILTLRDDPDLRRHLAARGRALYEARFTTHAIAHDLDAALARTLAGHAAPSAAGHR